MLIYTVAPLLIQSCIHGLLTGAGYVCNIGPPDQSMLQYQYSKPEESCYNDGIFYPRCKDIENPEVSYYHNLLYK